MTLLVADFATPGAEAAMPDMPADLVPGASQSGHGKLRANGNVQRALWRFSPGH